MQNQRRLEMKWLIPNQKQRSYHKKTNSSNKQLPSLYQNSLTKRTIVLQFPNYLKNGLRI